MPITIYQDASGYNIYTSSHLGFMYLYLGEAIVIIAKLCASGYFIDSNSRALYNSMIATHNTIKLNQAIERAQQYV